MADNLPNYPADPLDDKQMNQFVMLCLEEREQNYKKYSDKIGASCGEASKTPIKVQRLVVDRIKEVIKAKPTKHSAKQKFFALKLLNKIVMKKNTDLNNYVEAKIMSRLTILAEFNNNPEEKSAQLLLSRGKNIFGPEEKDHQNSANFLIILLDCIEKWALTFQFEEGEVDDAVSSSTRSKAQAGDKFYRCYTKLLEKGVKFPSTFQGKDRQVKKTTNAREGGRGQGPADQDEGPPQPSSNNPNAGLQQIPDDAQSQSTVSPFGASGLSSEKKERIALLKKKMQKVKDMSKQAKKYVDKSAQKKAGGEMADAAEILQKQAVFEENRKLGEEAITELMSDEIQPHISNSEALTEKLLGYQELFQKALELMERQIEQQRKLEEDFMGSGRQRQGDRPPDRRNSFNSDENANIDEGVGGGSVNRISVSATSMGGHDMGSQPRKDPKEYMMTNVTRASEIQFDFAMPPNQNAPQDFGSNAFGGAPQQQKRPTGAFSTNQTNPYDFENFSNKDMFQTQIQQNANFDGFNFDMPQQNENPIKQDSSSKKGAQYNFGFDFGAAEPSQQPMKSQMFKEKVPLPPEEEDAVIQPKISKQQFQRNAHAAAEIPDDKVNDENYAANEFPEQVDAGQFQEVRQHEFEGRRSLNQSLKNSRNIGDVQSRNSQIKERSSRVSDPKQNAVEKPQKDGFGFDFGGDAPESSQKPVAQNQDFNFQFDQPAQPLKQEVNEGFHFGEQPAPPKNEDKQGFDAFNFSESQPPALPDANKDDFFSYNEQAAPQPKGQRPNQGFNDFNFDDYGGNQYSQDQKQLEKENNDDQQIPQHSQPYEDQQIDSSSYPAAKHGVEDHHGGYGDEYYQEKPQEAGNFDRNDHNQQYYGHDESNADAKLSSNKEIFDYAEEMAARRITALNQKNTSKVEAPAAGLDGSESMASMQSDDVPAKLKNEKDLEVEKEIKKLREYIKDERITRWWHGQQGQAAEDLKSSLQQSYGLHQKSLMTNISQQIEQVDSYKTQIYSFEQENRILNEKYQQLVNNQSEDARRVSELEFEVDSFNAQISMIRQQCEKELRNKDDEVQEMKRALEAMKQEVDVAQKRCEHMNMVEDNHKAALVQKDQEMEKVRQQLQEIQMDNHLRQQKISNFDVDKKDYEQQIRNLQEQLAEEISRSEASQANDMALAQAKETMQQQFNQKEHEMQAKIAELEAQLSMAMSQDIKASMQKAAQVVEEKPAQSFNFNMAPPQQDRPVDQQLGITQKQDSGSSGNQAVGPRPSVPQGQNTNTNSMQLDFAQAGIGSQSMVVQPADANLGDRERSSTNTMAFQNQDQKQSMAESKASESSQVFGTSVQSATTGPGSASQVAQPNPAFSFDMSGLPSPSPAKQDQKNRTPRTMGSQQVSPKSLMQNQNSPGLQQQAFGQRPAPQQAFHTVQQNPQVANTFEQRRSTNPQVAPPTMMKPQLQSTPSQKSIGSAGQNPGAQAPSPGPVQAQFQQNFQQDLLKQKLQSFHLNALIQGEKCVIYEDVNVKIGLVRQYTAPQGLNGDIKCLFKVFFRNHNQQQIPMHGVQMQFSISEHGPQQQLVKMQRSSRPLPVRVPSTPPLKHNETIELDCDMSIRPMADPNVLPQQSTSFQGIKAVKFASIVLNLQYELNNGKKSGLLPICLPINILNFVAPYKSLNKYEYIGIWNKVVNTPQSQRPANTACLQTVFTLDKQKVANMQRLMQTMAPCFHHVLDVDPQPNQLSFAAQLKDTCLPDPNQDRAWLLAKMELTKEGTGCKLQCVAVKDNLQVALPVFEALLALVGKQQQA